MARLVLLNGAPGSGKSTLARRFVEDHPLALALDIDILRGMLGQWLDHSTEAGIAAREMALAAAKVRLLHGFDVVIPQFLGRLEFVEQLEELASETGSEFVEIALLSDPADAAQRFTSRSKASTTTEHRDAAVLVERQGGIEAFGEMYERLLELIASRPQAKVVETIDGEIEQTYQRLLTHLH